MVEKKAATVGQGRPPAANASTRGLHPVFGPVADPGPDDIFGGWGGGGGWRPGWHGPVVDPGPPFHGWLGTVIRPIEREALDPAVVKNLSALRVRRLKASIRALEERAAIAQEEFKLLSQLGDKLEVDVSQLPPWVDPGDPPPELRPLHFLRYVHELRAAYIQQTIAYMQESVKAIQARA